MPRFVWLNDLLPGRTFNIDDLLLTSDNPAPPPPSTLSHPLPPHHLPRRVPIPRPIQRKAVAEATINELKGRLAGRDQALVDLQALLDATKEQWLAQHQTDREEIARLNQALFERNNASIDNLKVQCRDSDQRSVGRQWQRSGRTSSVL